MTANAKHPDDMTTAVLLPGNMCDARLWAGAGGVILDIFVSRGLKVCHADLSRAASVADMASDTLARMHGPLLPIGFSMGGIVAMEMARQAPGRIVGLVLADTNAGADLPERAAVRPGQQARVRNGALATIIADELKPAYLAPANRENADLKTLLFDMAMQLGDDVFCAQSEALRTRGDGGPVLDDFPGPILLLAGSEDALCPPAWHQAMAERAIRPTLRVIEGAGHMLPLEQPAAFAAALAAWIDLNPELQA